jgi:hypothetical protein
MTSLDAAIVNRETGTRFFNQEEPRGWEDLMTIPPARNMTQKRHHCRIDKVE